MSVNADKTALNQKDSKLADLQHLDVASSATPKQ
tara:strand:- start:170 stop:271 length:102 start_codon:yes stop_codon:yes gene_type:complete